MIKRSNTTQYLLLAISLIFLFIISYLRFTWYINPNFSGDPLLIKIQGAGVNSGLLGVDEDINIDIHTRIRVRSILVFWILFGLVNILFCFQWKNFKQKIRGIILTYGGLTLILVFLLGFHMILRPEEVFYKMFSIIKNFLLSPLYTGVIFIFVRFFNRIVQ